MATSEVPVIEGVAFQEAQVPIEDRVYTLTLRWSGREARWYLDIYDEERAPLYIGIAIVLNFPLGIRCASADFWPGLLMAVDTSGANQEPNLNDLGTRVKLIYVDSEDLA